MAEGVMSRCASRLFALVSLLWGIPYVFFKLAVAGLIPVQVAFARPVIAAAVLAPVAVWRRAFTGVRLRTTTASVRA